MYSWCDVEGIQKFGQYEGNGDASEGVYVHCGFKPALLWFKRIDSTSDWNVRDSTRDASNPCKSRLLLQSTSVEGQSDAVDILSQGFKLYNSGNNFNNGGAKYVYCAWADMNQSSMFGATPNAR